MEPTTWTSFHCSDADFTVRSVPDGDAFRVQKACLAQGSDVFRDMFQCCDAGYVLGEVDDARGVLDLHEPAPLLALLLRLLHAPPAPPPADLDDVHVPAGAIPFPLLPALLALADKYALARTLRDACVAHLGAHASSHPLRVYGMAVDLGEPALAARASAFLLHPPLGTYTAAEIRAIPTAEAYHRLVLLHAHRITRVREILDGEQIFPQRYGECTWHTQRTKALWQARKKVVMNKVEAATDVAAEMMVDFDELSHCEACCKAWTAATAMLGYKCSKVPRRIDKLPAHTP